MPIENNCNRRAFLAAGASIPMLIPGHRTSVFGQGSYSPATSDLAVENGSHNQLGPIHSINPVVGDGKWISTEPPKNSTGFFEPRRFEVEIGIEAEGTGDATFMGSSVAPTEQPEQKLVSYKVQKSGCEAELQPLGRDAAQLLVAGRLSKGSRLVGKAVYQLEISKSYFGYSVDNLTAKTNFSSKVFGQWLGDSPGIQTHSGEVRKTATRLIEKLEHPYQWVQRFQEWVFENIRGKPMPYTSVKDAIKNRIGDCEERAGVFVALCRSAGIPARLVWVPNHAWAECCLFDLEDKPRWIPVHTAAYNWMGWTGAHELILQKGDRIHLPTTKKRVRLVADWMRWKGTKPKVTFTGGIRPVADESNQDPGPGTRQKDKAGRWNLTTDHEDQKYMRP